MKKIALAILATASITAIPALTGQVGATSTGDDGCTPGYWKNHTQNWEEYGENDTLNHMFKGMLVVGGDVTLIDALQGGGGDSGVDGARQILARAAVAAVLNAAHDDLGYPRVREYDGGTKGLIPDVVSAWNSDDRATILDLAARLDALNNLGCPLN